MKSKLKNKWVPFNHCNILPSTWWLETTENVLSPSRRPDIQVKLSSAPSEGSEGEPFLASSTAWLVAASLRSLFPSSRGLLPSLPVLLVRLLKTLALGCGAHQIIQNDVIWRSLAQIHLQRPFFQIRSQSQAPEVRIWTYLLGRPQFNLL